MSERLPKGWCPVEIGDLCRLINGKPFKPSDWSTSGIPIIRIQNLNNPFAKFNYYEGELPEHFIVKNGDLLFAWSGTPGTSFGAHVWNGNTAALNQHIFNIKFDVTCINSLFFRYAINQKLEELIGNAQGGVGLRHVTKGTFEKTKIHFPPLAEQKRIAAKLDTLLAKVDSCKARLDKVPGVRDLLLRKYIDYSSGELTTLGKMTKECKERIGPKWKNIPLIGVSNVDGITILRVGQKDSFENYKIVQPGDIIYNTMRVNIGSIARYNGTSIALTSPDYVVFRVNPSYSAEYVLLFLKSTFGLEEINKNTKGSVRSRLYYSSLAEIEIPISKNYTQNAIETNLDIFNKVIKKNESITTQLPIITASILAKAFRGELVPQDPNDEPAEELLERIRGLREAEVHSSKGRANVKNKRESKKEIVTLETKHKNNARKVKKSGDVKKGKVLVS